MDHSVELLNCSIDKGITNLLCTRRIYVNILGDSIENNLYRVFSMNFSTLAAYLIAFYIHQKYFFTRLPHQMNKDHLRYYYLSNVSIASNQHINYIYLLPQRVSLRFDLLYLRSYYRINEWKSIFLMSLIKRKWESKRRKGKAILWCLYTHFHDEIVEFSFRVDACWTFRLRKIQIQYSCVCVCVFQALLYYFIYG